jgi:hypothetical protein
MLGELAEAAEKPKELIFSKVDRGCTEVEDRGMVLLEGLDGGACKHIRLVTSEGVQGEVLGAGEARECEE